MWNLGLPRIEKLGLKVMSIEYYNRIFLERSGLVSPEVRKALAKADKLIKFFPLCGFPPN